MTSPTPPLADLAPVWRALADPHRRRILDLLRQGPLRTGDVAAELPMSRYGAMKHLGVLVEAGLVFVRRRGRERWNHLNAVPIQQIYRRWIRPFEAPSADALLRLKAAAEHPRTERGETMSEAQAATPARGSELRSLDVEHEIRIGATPERVWEVLTEEASGWWPASFYVGAEPRGFTVEAKVGGRVYEDWGGGQGVLWATVLVVRRGELLQWAGDLAPEFGGPARSVTSFRLEADGEGTRLKFRDSAYGSLSASTLEALEEGWRFLLEECLKPYAEEGRHPERPQTVAGGR